MMMTLKEIIPEELVARTPVRRESRRSDNEMENYLLDVLDQLIAEASQIKAADSEFQTGRLHGYYETISRLLNQAEAFGLSEILPERLRNYCVEDLLNTN